MLSVFEKEFIMKTRIRELRKARKLSQEELADRLGVSRQAISRWELGATLPDVPNLLKLSDLFGVSTDYSHIKYIYDSISEQEALRKKTRCCALEFVRFQNEHYPDENHASLVDAMRTLGIGWDGIPHSSIADTIACMKVWEALFPNYYTTPMPELPDYSAMTPAAAPAFNEATGEYVRIETNAEDKEESYV